MLLSKTATGQTDKEAVHSWEGNHLFTGDAYLCGGGMGAEVPFDIDVFVFSLIFMGDRGDVCCKVPVAIWFCWECLHSCLLVCVYDCTVYFSDTLIALVLL